VEKKIDLCREPSAFFHERVSEAMQRQRFETIKIAEFYLVDLLGRFMLTSNLFNSSNDQPKESDPLAIMFLKAQAAGVEGTEKVKILKKLGDTSLYISGVFGDSLNRKVIDLDYYREMGAIAYRSLSEAIREDSFQELYNELHAKFTGFVDILTEVSQELFVHDNQNLLRLYELYVRTGSELAKKQLAEKGLPTTPIVAKSDKKPSRN
jgi:hypothetical protein